jgi:spore coat protein U-like protein
MAWRSLTDSIATRSVFLALGLVLSHASAQADTTALTVTATVLSKNSCKMGNAALALGFLAIDPSSTSNASASTTTTFTCKGSDVTAVFAVAANDGLYASAAGLRRMRHGTDLTQFLSYSLAITPSSGTATKNVAQTITITGTVTPGQFADAIAGPYSDTVSITVAP